LKLELAPHTQPAEPPPPQQQQPLQSPSPASPHARTEARSLAGASTEDSLAEPLRFEFTGTGSEYFRIWVVNLLLTILTLGIYSAWAKVRRLRYFYRNTRLDGAIFDYHGNPKAILKGRILALLLVAAYKIAADISALATVCVILVLAGIMPWLLARSFRFKLANSSYRGLRFRFQASVADAYRSLILLPAILAAIGFFAWSVFTSYANSRGVSGMVLVAILLTIGALVVTVPLSHFLLKRFQHDNAAYGQTAFYFHARLREFFKIYAKAIGYVSLGGTVVRWFYRLTAPMYEHLAQTRFGWLFALLYSAASSYIAYMFVRAFLESRIQNLVWNETEIGPHRFMSEVSTRRLLWIHAMNLLLTVLTLGLYKPFAAVRLVKYRVESMHLSVDGSLEEFMADQTVDDAGALGQEAGDLFDIEIAL
jgi:uncharacterized membrane protein YjgN (DUF898 family)